MVRETMIDDERRRDFMKLMGASGVAVFAGTTAASDNGQPSRDGITVSKDNPWYFEYKGEPVILIGGFEDDNPFQWTGDELTEALDLLESVGGNFVRNVLSYRDEGNVPPFAENEDEIYDLEELGEEFQERLVNFLNETQERNLIVQITFWDQFDHLFGGWEGSPWHPANNVNYTEEESDLPEKYDAEFGEVSTFYNSVEEGNDVLLNYQEQYVESILDLTLPFDHVLYNINNESWAPPSWDSHWLEFIYSYAKEQGIPGNGRNHEHQSDRSAEVHDAFVHGTGMRISPDQAVAWALNRPDVYSYVEISQSNQNAEGATGQQHWDNIQSWRAELCSHDAIRPLSNEKIYGGFEEEQGEHQEWAAGTAEEAIERFWRDIIGGCATARFHRSDDGWGLGLRELVQRQLESARMVINDTDLIEATPSDSIVLDRDLDEVHREPNEAYCAANREAGEYIVYFPSGGHVLLDAAGTSESFTVQWLDINNSEWAEESSASAENYQLELETPSDDRWVAVICEE